MAEFSTTKITPTDDVQIPSINGQVAGYQENDELKSYVLGTIPTDVSGHTADITGIRGTSLDYDPDSTTYTKGATCILNHIVYRAKQLIPSPAGAFDSSKWEEVSLHEIARKVATNTDAITSLSADVTNLGAKTVQGEFSLTLSFSGLTTGIFWNNQDRDITLVPSPSVVRGIVLYPKSDYAVWIGRIVLSNNKLVRLYLYSTSNLTDVTIAFDYVAFLL